MGLGADENDDEDVVLDEDAGRERTDTRRYRRARITGIAMDSRDEDEGQNEILALRGGSETKCGQKSCLLFYLVTSVYRRISI